MAPIILKSRCKRLFLNSLPHANFAFSATLPYISIEQEKPSWTPGIAIDNMEESEIRLDLIVRAGTTTGTTSAFYDLQLGCMKKSPCQLFKTLWSKYKDEVKISVTLTSPTVANIFSVSGMTIDRKTFACRGSLGLGPLTVHYLEAIFSLDFSWDVKITLDIPEGSTKKNMVHEEGGHSVLHKILEENLCSDLIITAKNGVKVEAHRLILAAHSPVFLANFKSGMKESQTGTLDMSDVSEEAVRALLDFLYKHDLTKARESLEVAFELLCAGHMYQMPKLEAAMKKRFMEARDEDIGTKLAYKVYKFLRQTETEAASELKTKIVEFLISKMDEFKELPEIQELFQRTLQDGIGALDVFQDFVLINSKDVVRWQNIGRPGTGDGDSKCPRTPRN